MALSSDGRRLLCATASDLRLFAVPTPPAWRQAVPLVPPPLVLHELARVRTAATVTQLAFSPDDKYFAARSESERFVKLWCSETRERGVWLSPTGVATPPPSVLRALYLTHPNVVQSVMWRDRQRPLLETLARARGSRTATYRNMLVTLARDGVVRLWLEVSIVEAAEKMCPDIDVVERAHGAAAVRRVSRAADERRRASRHVIVGRAEQAC
jgi:WD40 repeat protein